jgi:hypothetical protein
MKRFTSRLDQFVQAFRSGPCPKPDRSGLKDQVTGLATTHSRPCGSVDREVFDLWAEPRPEECRGEMAGLVSRVGSGETISVVDASRHALF